jgi:hypothetical protein
MRNFIIGRGYPALYRGAFEMNIRVILLWLVVGLPLAWGILKTLENALKLFH